MIVAKREAIVRARIQAGLTQRGLSRIIGVSNGFISEIERGISNPGPVTAKKICDTLGVEFDAIFDVVLDEPA